MSLPVYFKIFSTRLNFPLSFKYYPGKKDGKGILYKLIYHVCIYVSITAWRKVTVLGVHKLRDNSLTLSKPKNKQAMTKKEAINQVV